MQGRHSGRRDMGAQALCRRYGTQTSLSCEWHVELDYRTEGRLRV